MTRPLCPECKQGKPINCTRKLEDGSYCATWQAFLDSQETE
jgi:hypothetical protein